VSNDDLSTPSGAKLARRPDTTTTLEHDPDSGCDCPLQTGSICAAKQRGPILTALTPLEGPAPAWCPLRAGPVTVRRKERAT
jgi:hypothetical protein